MLTADLPGVTFEVVTPAPPDTLPRMDVAAFVGFASSGPVDVPVAVEDVPSFRDVFGPDPELARGPDGRTERAHLGGAVEAFFRNGGQRCWVVRVARASDDEAVATQAPPAPQTFPVPGLVAIDGDGSDAWRVATVRARSPGSWADGLQVGAVLTPRPLAVEAVDGTGVVLRGAEELAVGDLIRLTFGDAHVALVTVADVEDDGAVRVDLGTSIPAPHGVTAESANALNRRRRARTWWFATRPPSGEVAAVPDVVERLTPAGWDPIDILDQRHPDRPTTPEAIGPQQLTMVAVGDGTGLRPGELLRVAGDTDGPWLLPVRAQLAPGEVPAAGRAATEGSPPGDGIVWFEVGPGWWPLEEAPESLLGADASPPRPRPFAERLRFELVVWRDDAVVARLGGLDPSRTEASASGSRRFWGDLPTDAALFGRLADPGPAPDTPASERLTGARARTVVPRELWDDAHRPRFPLAGPGDAGRHHVPLGMALVADRSRSGSALGPTDPRSRLARDGLDRFGAWLFLDDRLATASVRTLPQKAFTIRHVAATPRPLRGLHRLLDLDDVTLVAVPDAVHPGWTEQVVEREEPLGAPHLDVSEQSDGAIVVTWSELARATAFELEQASDAAFTAGVHRSTHLAEDVADAGNGSFVEVGVPPGCPALRFFRVRGVREGVAGPWSNTEVVLLPTATFRDVTPLPRAPVLTADGPDATGTRTLTWTRPGASTRSEFASSPDPSFRAGVIVVTHAGDRVEVPPGRHGPSYHRVRVGSVDAAGRATHGPWSNTIVVAAEETPRWVAREVDPDAVADELLAIQLALLRLCAARADCLAVLAVPAPALAEHVHAHVAELRGGTSRGGERTSRRFAMGVPRLDAAEAHALGCGALYHPWTSVRAAHPGGVRIDTRPPDGPMVGVMAARSLARGAWVAPAHRPLEDALGLTPKLAADAPGRLLADGVNVLVEEPSGFVAVGSTTLGRDTEQREINVRRLMMLLRRLVLRHGSTYVFQPHDAQFRALVRSRLEQLLLALYQRGAFVGATPSQAFRVIADDTVNPPALVDRGRFVVEIAVAPSQPLRFLTIRLLQTGPGTVSVEEV